MKKFLCSLAALSFVSGAFADVEVRLAADYNIPTESMFDSVLGFSGCVEVSPITLRKRDKVYVTLGGGYTELAADGIESVGVTSFEGGIGYNLRLNDRFSISAEGFAGIWSIGEEDNQNFKSDAASGILFGGKGFVNFHILPELTVSLFGGYKRFDYDPEPIIQNVQAGLSVKYNLSKGLFGESSVKVENPDEVSAGPLFPVFYSRYGEHSFGTMTFINGEPNDIKDVEVSVFIEQFMSNPDVAAKAGVVKRGETFSVDLTAYLNEGILNNLSATRNIAKVAVKYRSLGKIMTSVHDVELTTFGRNSMTWADDRAAAAFISPRDASALKFARLVNNMVKSEFVAGKPENIQFAAAISSALKVYGLNYVIDPNSAFVDNVGSTSVDFLQFPYQTLLYHGGDCDDLSILSCALFESVGIDTALITVPGHIYMAFDSGVSPKETSKIADGQFIVQGDKVWIPYEVTMCQDSFAMQRQTGYREWTSNKKDRALIPLKDAWKEYKAVGIPDSDVKIEMPSKSKVLKAFKNNNN